MGMSRATDIRMHTFTLNVSHARTRCMNFEMKKLRKELPHGRARHVAVPLRFGGSRTRWVRCRRWRVATVPPATSANERFLWHERLGKLANRSRVRGLRFAPTMGRPSGMPGPPLLTEGRGKGISENALEVVRAEPVSTSD